jgi:hypothetical protein
MSVEGEALQAATLAADIGKPEAEFSTPRGEDVKIAPPRPRSGALLMIGYLVLVPLVAMAMVVIFTFPSADIAGVLKVEITYSVALLSFIGGIRWGIALMAGAGHLRFRPLALITLTLPYAWSILFMTPPVALAALMAGFLLVALVERVTDESPVPRWYHARLIPFTVMIEIALGLTLIFILNG